MAEKRRTIADNGVSSRMTPTIRFFIFIERVPIMTSREHITSI